MTADAHGVIVGCTSCSKLNRLPYESLDRTIRCGHCKTMLASPGQPLEIDDSATFRAATTTSALPVVIDFWAPWCGPCRTVAPELERVATHTAGKWLIVKLNTDAVTDVAAEFRIRSIPTMAVVFRGRELARTSGARPAADIQAFVEQALATDAQRAS